MTRRSLSRVAGRVHPVSVAVLLASLAVAGCIGGIPAAPQPIDAASAGSSAEVVVAFVDSGVNFFHRAFRADTLPPAFVQAEPIGFDLNATFTDAFNSIPWNDIEPGKLYWIRGTRILAVHFGESPLLGEPVQTFEHYPLYDERDHGTGVAGKILEANPDAWLVSVEIEDNNPGFLKGLSWAASQPWVDVISMSYGANANLYLPIEPSLTEATRTAVQGGKIVVNGAGNDPTLIPTDDSDGPPWVISVGAARNSTQGWVVVGSHMADVVANYVTRGPTNNDTEGDEAYSGTSFSSPVVSGTLSRVVLELRRAAAHRGGIVDGYLVPELNVTGADIRGALNRSAIYWNATDYDAVAGIERSPLATVAWGTAPILPSAGPAGPWVVAGWGFVNASIAPLMVDDLLGEHELPEKPAEAQAYMDLVQQVRTARWSDA
jgi:subtilase family protein